MRALAAGLLALLAVMAHSALFGWETEVRTVEYRNDQPEEVMSIGRDRSVLPHTVVAGPVVTTTTLPAPTTTTMPQVTTTTVRAWKPADECSRLSRPVSAGAMRWCGAVAEYLYRTGEWQEGDLTKLMRTLDCESGGDPNAKNPRSTASGLFQFLDGSFATWGPRAADFFGFDNPTKNAPLDNIAAGVLYYVNAGPAPWPNCGKR